MRDLVSELRPVKPVSRPRLLAGLWSGASLALALELTSRLGFREAPPWGQIAVLLAAVFAAAYLGVLLSLPGREIPLRVRLTPYGLFAIYLALLLRGEWGSAAGAPCALRIALLALLPGAFLFLLLRWLAAVDGRRAARVAGLAMGAVGALGVTLHCPSSESLHLVIFHAAPVFLLGLAAQAFATRLLRW